MKQVFPERMNDLKNKSIRESIEDIERYIRYMSERIEILNKEVNKLKEETGVNNAQTI